jgi:Ca2+-binding EF-hand superfamily protein
MVSLGFESKNGAIFRMITDLDSDGNGTIDFP